MYTRTLQPANLNPSEQDYLRDSLTPLFAAYTRQTLVFSAQKNYNPEVYGDTNPIRNYVAYPPKSLLPQATRLADGRRSLVMTVAATLRPFFAAGEEIDHTYREAGSSRNIFYVSRDNATLTTAPANFVALSLQFTAAYKVFKLINTLYRPDRIHRTTTRINLGRYFLRAGEVVNITHWLPTRPFAPKEFYISRRNYNHSDNDPRTEFHILEQQRHSYSNIPWYSESVPFTRDHRRHSSNLAYAKPLEYFYTASRVGPNIDFIRYKFNIQAYCLDNRYSVTVSWTALPEDMLKITGDDYTEINFYVNTVNIGEVTTGAHSFIYTPGQNPVNQKESIAGYINNKHLLGNVGKQRCRGCTNPFAFIRYPKANPPTLRAAATPVSLGVERFVVDNFEPEDLELYKQLYFDHTAGTFNVNNVILPLERSLSSKITVTLKHIARDVNYLRLSPSTLVLLPAATITMEKPHTKLNPCTARSGFLGWPTNSYIFNNYPLVYGGRPIWYFCEMQKLIPPQEIPYHTGRRATEEIYHIKYTPDFWPDGPGASYKLPSPPGEQKVHSLGKL